MMQHLRAILEQLEDIELTYVFERSKVNSNRQALINSGIPQSIFYSWPKEEQERLNKLAQELKRNRVLAAEMVLIESAERAAEVLTDQARATIEDFVTLDEKGAPVLDLKRAGERGKLHLIKKLNYDKDNNLRSIELHDAQHAADSVLDRTAGRPVQKQELSGPGGGPIPFDLDEWKRARQERLSEADEVE